MKRTLLALVGAFASVAALGNTYTVTSTADSGAGTLRQAILDANGNPGVDTIAFGVVGTGPHTISLASPLPAITGPSTVDGYTQAGSSVNTNPTSLGLNTVLQIEIDCTNVGAATCMVVSADDVTLKGFVINRAPQYEIDVTGGHQGFVIEGCFLGTDPSGTQIPAPFQGSLRFSLDANNARIGGTTPAARNLFAGLVQLGGGAPGFHDSLVAGNLIGTDITGKKSLNEFGSKGLSLFVGSNNVIGGTTPAARNVISGGINVGGSGTPGIVASDNLIQGNYVDIDVTGTFAFGCHNECIALNDPDNTVGGATPGAGNLVGGSDASGISVYQSATGSVIQGNFIGTDETGLIRLRNPTYGIRVLATGTIIGGVNPGEGNVISNSGLAGVGVENAGKATIRGNAIFDNPGGNYHSGLAIDLLVAGNGVTLNDAGDADAGPNGLQNFPVLSSVTYGVSTTTVAGVLDSAPSTIYDLDFYADPICERRPQDLPEARTYIGSSTATTDGSGHAVVNVILPVALPDGSPVSATAIDPAGNTSELSPRAIFYGLPSYGPSGATIVLTGLAFEDGATATVGGAAASNVQVTDVHTLSLKTPSLPPGSVNSIVVSNPGGPVDTLPNGWLTDFLDVASSHQFYLYVMRLVGNGITAGVGGGFYGPAQNTKRQQMAVFLLKAAHGACYVPPPCSGVFPDVPCSNNFAPWIEQLAAEGITGGCGGGNYCPDNPVRRDQMAVFLLKGKHGSQFIPPPCDGHFTDVPCPGPFADWIEQLQAEGVTGGCGGTTFCPQNNVTRGQMAAFLVNAFSLP